MRVPAVLLFAQVEVQEVQEVPCVFFGMLSSECIDRCITAAAIIRARAKWTARETKNCETLFDHRHHCRSA